MRRAELRTRHHGQGLHLLGAGHIHLAGQHLRTGGTHFGRGGVQRVLLHVNEHQVHAQAGPNARALQAEA